MGSYNKSNKSYNKSGSRKYSSGGGRGRDSGPRQMHKAVCSNCGDNCEVPFKPSGDKPIYCSECYEKKGGGSSQRSDRGSRRPSYRKPDNTSKQLLDQMVSLNAKLDRVLKVLEGSEEKTEKKPAAKKAAPKAKEVVVEEKVVKEAEQVKETKKVTKKPAAKTTKAEAKKE